MAEKQGLVDSAKSIIRELNRRGFSAYMVGGYVRDRLLGRAVKDIDIATSATPDQVVALFPHTAATGVKHGTVTVIMDGQGFEVTTFRSEAGYSDLRRPDQVRFITDLTEDLSRRDFTINAMAMDADEALYDPFHGMEDLRTATLRCVGDPKRRFSEDALRMLRCVRFAAEYKLEIEKTTWHALVHNRHKLAHIAMERVQMELARIVAGSDPARGAKLLAASGLLAHTKTALPVLFHPNVVAEADSLLSLIPLFHESAHKWAFMLIALRIDANDGGKLLKSLKFAKHMQHRTLALVRLHEWMANELSRLSARSDDFPSSLQNIWRAGCVRFSPASMSVWLDLMNLAAHASGKLPGELSAEIFAALYGQAFVLRKRMPVAAPADLSVNGSDLLRITARSPGPWLGKLLDKLYEEVIYERVPNDRERLCQRALELIRDGADT
ncbi:MAG TPA: CCA tRNA nucleotidyltransferase [Bacilli bacterium]